MPHSISVLFLSLVSKQEQRLDDDAAPKTRIVKIFKQGDLTNEPKLIFVLVSTICLFPSFHPKQHH